MDVSNYGLVHAEGQSLDTVRTLHQTVQLLRSALDKSKLELKELRTKVQSQIETTRYENTIEQLAIENHVLRQKIIDHVKVPDHLVQLQITESMEQRAVQMDSISETKDNVDKQVGEETVQAEDTEKVVDEVKNEDTGKEENTVEESVSEVPVTTHEIESQEQDKKEHKDLTREPSEDADQSQCSETSQPDFQGDKNNVESDNESEEVDNIELIFTNDDTKELGVLQEDLVSFADNEGWQTSTPHIKVKFQDADSFDETAEIENEVDYNREQNKTDRMQYNLKPWTHSVFVETDISKCGVVDENEAPSRSPRRNTLPNPLVYQPIMHREILNGSKGQIGTSPISPRPFGAKFFPPNRSSRNGSNMYGKSPVRPILVERNSVKRESEAQTDITALPLHWKSESYLAHKVSNTFTTLPSKFALPVPQNTVNYSLKLSDKTQEARRTLLSDINFTSMVPELSRSADHLCREGRENCANANLTPGICKNYPRAHSYMKSTTENLISPGYFQSRDYGKDMWSPCECGQSNLTKYSRVRTNWDSYEPVTPRYRGSLTSMPSYEYGESKRRHSSSTWRDSPEMYRSVSMSQRPTYGSVPSSPTHGLRSRSVTSYASSRNDVFPSGSQFGSMTSRSGRQSTTRSRPRNKVTFSESSIQRSGRPGQSLPDLRSDFGPESGDSTDSLIDEAEEYLRRSIDSILTGTDYTKVGARRRQRRYSDPDPIREFVPPKTAQPFLPKVPRDLKLDHLVKVINGEGRVKVGRVRYVGTVQTGGEAFVGVEFPTDAGNSDGSWLGRRYFDCDPDHALFVPFKKVVIAWSF